MTRVGLAGLLGALALAVSPAPARAQLANSDFDADIAPWADPFPDATTAVGWSPIDASGNPSSGSIQVETNKSAAVDDGPASECLAPASRHQA